MPTECLKLNVCVFSCCSQSRSSLWKMLPLTWQSSPGKAASLSASTVSRRNARRSVLGAVLQLLQFVDQFTKIRYFKSSFIVSVNFKHKCETFDLFQLIYVNNSFHSLLKMKGLISYLGKSLAVNAMMKLIVTGNPSVQCAGFCFLCLHLQWWWNNSVLGSAQTLGTGRDQVGRYHGDQKEGRGRRVWGPAGRRGWQSRLQVTTMTLQTLDDISRFLNPRASTLWRRQTSEVLFIKVYWSLSPRLTEQSRNLQITWKKKVRPAASLLRRRPFWNRDSTCPFSLSDSSFLTL